MLPFRLKSAHNINALKRKGPHSQQFRQRTAKEWIHRDIVQERKRQSRDRDDTRETKRERERRLKKRNTEKILEIGGGNPL